MKENIKLLKQKIVKILKENGVKRAGIFGSYARGEANENSDIDILVEFDKNISLFDFVGIKLELEDNLKRKVDLTEYKVIKPRIKRQILNEEVKILWKEILSYF